VPESMEGRGVGSELVRQALDHVRERGVTIKPVCPFTAAYLERHPEEADVVHPDYRWMVEKNTFGYRAARVRVSDAVPGRPGVRRPIARRALRTPGGASSVRGSIAVARAAARGYLGRDRNR